MKRKKVVILGSTGSIGINCLKVIAKYPEQFEVVGLSAYNNSSLLEKQIREFKPRYVAISRNNIVKFRQKDFLADVKIYEAETGLEEIVSLKEVDLVVIGMLGGGALGPFLKAVQCGKTVAPANKEALVIAGDIIMREAAAHNAKIIPVDSEQSAIFQCLEGQNKDELEKVYLTASGGALHRTPRSRFSKLTVAEILDHPRWKMGKKITVDSASLMNKGFEIIEAKWLFDLSIKQVEVVIHPEAIIHSMVCYRDGSVISQMGIPDMRLPIQYALTYPERWETSLKPVDFFELGQLNFSRPDYEKFPCLSLAVHAAQQGGTLPCVLNAADEVAVDAFLNEQISFVDIFHIVEKAVLGYKNIKQPDLDDIQAADTWARQKSDSLLKQKR